MNCDTRMLARRQHPATSHEAAQRLSETGTLAEHTQVALALVRLYPGSTGAELDARANADKRQISKRLAGLADQASHLIRRGPARLCSINNSRALTWWPTRKSDDE